MNRRDYINYPQAGWDKHKPHTQVCMAVDAPGCLKVFENTLMSNWLKEN